MLGKVKQWKCLDLVWHPRWRRIWARDSPRDSKRREGRRIVGPAKSQGDGEWPVTGLFSIFRRRALYTTTCVTVFGNEQGMLRCGKVQAWRGVSGCGKWKGDRTFICFIQNGPILLLCITLSLLQYLFFHYHHPSCPRKEPF